MVEGDLDGNGFLGCNRWSYKVTMSKQAIIFPGQGAQKVGMLADAAKEYAEVKTCFAQASEVLGYDLWALAQEGSQEQLNLTEITQPLLLTSSIALWRVWLHKGGSVPAYVAGHSLGEYSALVAAGVLEFKAAVDLVRKRGSYMQDAVPVGTGAMSAVLGLDDEKVGELCRSISNDSAVVEAVNFNSPGQVVIAGHKDAVESATVALKEAGAKRVAALPVSAPFHTSLMQPAGEKLAADMQSLKFSAPQIPVIHNVHAKFEKDPEAIRELMVKQTSSAVLWTSCVQAILDQDISNFVECGPGKVLCGLVKKIERSSTVASIESPETLEQLVAVAV